MRDCEHGRLARKCEACEIVRLEQVITRLDRQVDDLNAEVLRLRDALRFERYLAEVLGRDKSVRRMNTVLGVPIPSLSDRGTEIR